MSRPGAAICLCGEKFCRSQLMEWILHLRQEHGLDVLAAEIADPALLAASFAAANGTAGR